MLYVVATPIGNLEDISLRAIRVLGQVEVLVCEDTRRTRILFERHGIGSPKKIISYREDNERTALPGILKLLDEGKDIVLVTDAGYPGISDPGYRLISESVERGIDIEIIPGAGAVTMSLLKSGLPSDSFTFKGFAPKKPGALKKFLELDAELPHTLIFFESPQRVGKFLSFALEVLGDRKAAVCMELTKKFERVSRGYLSDLAEEFREKVVKGEVTVVVSGKNKKFMRERGD